MAPSLGAKNIDMAMLNAPNNPPSQAHQGIVVNALGLNHAPP